MTVGGGRTERSERVTVNQRNVAKIVDLTPGALPVLPRHRRWLFFVSRHFSDLHQRAAGAIHRLHHRWDRNTENHAGVSLVINPAIKWIAELKVQSVGIDAQLGALPAWSTSF